MLLKLLKKRGNSYYFRWQIPKKLQPIFKKSEIIKTLETDSLELAVLKAEPYKKWIREVKKITEDNYDEVIKGLDELLSDWDDGQFPRTANELPITQKHLKNWIQSYEVLMECYRLNLVPDSMDANEAFANSVQGLKLDLDTLGYEPLESSTFDRQLIRDYSEIELKYFNEMQAHFDPKSQTLDVSCNTRETKIYPKISELLEPFIKFKIGNNSKLGEGSIEGYEISIADIVFVFGDLNTNEITADHAEKFRDTLLKLPTHRNTKKALKGLSCSELLKLEDYPTFKSKTISDKLGTLKSIFQWACSTDRSPKNPFKLISINVEKDPYADFSIEDLNFLFNSPIYDPESTYAKNKRTKVTYWWFPLMMLYTGARPSELMQLALEDFKTQDGVLFADLTDEENAKRLKTKAAKRKVAIHKTLIDLGIKEYLSELEKIGADRFFFDISLGTRKPASTVSTWFNERYRAKSLPPKWKDQKKTLYSFRCTHITEALNKDANLRNLQEYVGHEPSRMGATKHYDRGATIKQIKTTVDLVAFDNLDLSHLKNGWKFHLDKESSR